MLKLSLVEKLKEISWFSNCGSKNAKSKYGIVYADDLKSVIKHCSSTHWYNLRLECRNDVSDYLGRMNIPEDEYWNDYARLICDVIAPDIEPIIQKQWENQFEWTKAIRDTVMTDVRTYLLINCYRQFYQEPFHDEIISIYEQGYLPCGWKGTYPEGKLIVF